MAGTAVGQFHSCMETIGTHGAEDMGCIIRITMVEVMDSLETIMEEVTKTRVLIMANVRHGIQML